MTYAHSIQITELPRVINGSTVRHFADFVGEYAVDQSAKTFMDELVESVTEDPDPREEAIKDCYTCAPYGAPVAMCAHHGYIYSREQYDEHGERPYYMTKDRYDEYAYWHYYDGDCCTDVLPDVHCSWCGRVYDIENLSSYEYYGYSNYQDYYDDNFPYGGPDDEDDWHSQYNVEDNPEAAEYDIVETYTDRERMFHRFYDDRRRQYDQKEATRNRYLTSTSQRNRRRDGLEQWRGHHFSWFGIEFKGYEAGRTDRLTYLEAKRTYVD